MIKFNKSPVYYFVLSSLIVMPTLAVAKGAAPNGKPFVELEGKIIEIEGEVSTLQDQMSSLIGRVDTLEQNVTANQDAIIALTLESASLQTQIDTHGTDIVSLQDQIDDINLLNSSLQNQIDTLNGTDDALQQQIDDNGALIVSLQTALDGLSSLQDQIDNNSDLIAALSADVDDLENLIMQKQNIINGTCSEGETFVSAYEGVLLCRVAVSGGGSSSAIADRILVRTRYEPTRPTNYSAGYAAFCPEGYTINVGGYYVRNFDVTMNEPGFQNLRRVDANGIETYNNFDHYARLDSWTTAGSFTQSPSLVLTKAICTKFN